MGAKAADSPRYLSTSRRCAITISSGARQAIQLRAPGGFGRSARSRCLPEAHPLLGSQVHLVPVFDAKRLIERCLVHFRHGAANLVWSVRIGLDPFNSLVLACLAAPDLTPAHVEALVAGQAVDSRGPLAAE